MHKLFPGQQDDEKIYLVVREHWVHLAQKVLIWLVLVAALIMFRRYVPTILPQIFAGTAGKVTALFEQIYGLFLLLVIFLIWVFYYLNMQIITNLRIVDVDQNGLFNHTVSELHIDKIEDVTSKVTGVLGTIFDYGDVYVQTAAAVDRFEFTNVPHPAKLEKVILDLYEKRPKGIHH
jgi:hypothetical protein